MKDALAREAVRILADLCENFHVKGDPGELVHIEADVPLHVFDRMCVWGAAASDFEDDDPIEDNGDVEAELYD